MNQKKRITPGKVVLTALFVLLSLSFFFAVFQAIHSIREVDYSWDYYTEEYYLSCLQHGDYAELTRMANQDQRLEDENSETIRQCQAAGFYYQSAVLHQAFTDAGMTEKASKQARLMEKYQEEMGDLASYAEDIREKAENLPTKGES